MAIPVIPPFIQKMDWALLREQKDHLHEIMGNPALSQDEVDAVDGIMCLIDAIQDYACDDLQFTTKEIFGEEIEDEE